MIFRVENSVCHTPYLRNHTSYDFHLCIYSANDNNDNGTNENVFFYFIKILIFQVFRGHQKGKKKYTKNSANCTLYLSNHTSYDCHLWFTSVSWWYFQTFFFKKNWFFSKMTKNGPNWENICLLDSTSQEPYVIFCHLWLINVKSLGIFFLYFF